MRILFVHPSIEVAISDVARGFRTALERAGHDIRDYHMAKRLEYHRGALPADVREDRAVLARQASETILNEALYHKSELVLIISGLNVHPIALWLLGKVNIRVAVILTESPYEDEHQNTWMDLSKVDSTVDMTAFTNDRYSAERYGWHHLPPAFDPSIHYPAEPIPEEDCDVILVGTGWRERQVFLEAVNWTGINLKIFGVWPGLSAISPLHKFYHPVLIDNARIAPLYRSAKICLNFHRRDPDALTPNPRTFELAGCKAFQISDYRRDMWAMFGDNIPTFDTPQSLETLIRNYLIRPEARAEKAQQAFDRVQHETFDDRVHSMMEILTLQGAAQ